MNFIRTGQFDYENHLICSASTVMDKLSVNKKLQSGKSSASNSLRAQYRNFVVAKDCLGPTLNVQGKVMQNCTSKNEGMSSS